ncbi:MAG: ArsR/SmtB family transcription factor [Microcystaceae cyanobacterium]
MTTIPSKSDLDLMGKGFHALSDGLRLKVLELLQTHELCVCELCDELDVKQSKLSFHLKKLKEAQLVNARQEGRWIYYGINIAQFTMLEEYIAQYSRLTSTMPPRLCKD